MDQRAQFEYIYNTMGRLNQIKEPTSYPAHFLHIAEINYGVAGEIGNIKYNNWAQTQYRYYNARLQLTRMTAPGMDIEYLYSATNNNGQITGMKQWNGSTLVQHVAYRTALAGWRR